MEGAFWLQLSYVLIIILNFPNFDNTQKCFFPTSVGVPVTVVMPVTAPIMKVENCKKMGAKVVIYGGNFGEAKRRALQIADRKKLLYVNG